VKKVRGRGIQSLETGLRIFSALAESDGPIALSILSKRVGMSPSQTHRYLASLIIAGVVKQNPATGLYDLDAGAMRLGLAALTRLDIFAEADAVFTEHAKSTGFTSLISVWGDAGPVIIRWYPGDPPVITSLYIGSTMPLLQSATGRIFFVFGNKTEVDPVARRERKQRLSKTELEEMRDDIMRAHVSAIESTMIPGLRAVAAPIFDLQGHLALVGTSVVAAHAAGTTGVQRMVATLEQACRKVTEAIGGKWFKD